MLHLVLSGAFICIGLVALVMSHPVTLIPVALLVYALWRTC